MATNNPVSTLAAALAPGNDILKPRDAGHPATNHSLRSSNHRGGGLPTPPNSLSPTLPPQKGSPSVVASTPLNIIDSDIDLHDAPSSSLSDDATGDITPTLLAKHHLPDILLHNGPLAIRYVLAHLTSTVPGFARIPAAKARRIVVAALENRSGGGLNGDVVFEKVGWGRWDARYRSQKSRSNSSRHVSVEHHHAIRHGRRVSPLSPTVDVYHVSEHEADKMSLDGDDDVDRRRRIPVIEAPEDSDMTDEEDWESIGPDGLLAQPYAVSWASRRNSRSSSMGPRPSLHSATRPIPTSKVREALSISSSLPNGKKRVANPVTHLPCLNAATSRSMSYSSGILPFSRVYSSSLTSSIRMQGVQGNGSARSPVSERPPVSCGDPQEVEAIEALLRMGSM